MLRTLLVFLVLLSTTGAACAQDPIPEPTQNPLAPYRLFRTKNIYTFLQLDTRTGQAWQVHWGLRDGTRFVAPLNRTAFVEDGKPGRFTMYPTSNIYTFILLDQETGGSWQVQWGDEGQRFTIPIR